MRRRRLCLVRGPKSESRAAEEARALVARLEARIHRARADARVRRARVLLRLVTQGRRRSSDS